MRFLKASLRIERKPPQVDRVWWKTFTAQNGFILVGLGVVILATGSWLFGLLCLAAATWLVSVAWRRWG
jgi:hypothetical protein